MTFYRGIGKGRGGSGFFVWDEEQKRFVKVADRRGDVASKTSIQGEPVVCKRGGEYLELDEPGKKVFVADAAEKRRELKKRGLMPSPENWEGSKKSVDLPSFEEFFHKEHGMPLKEATGLVHGVED